MAEKTTVAIASLQRRRRVQGYFVRLPTSAARAIAIIKGIIFSQRDSCAGNWGAERFKCPGDGCVQSGSSKSAHVDRRSTGLDSSSSDLRRAFWDRSTIRLVDGVRSTNLTDSGISSRWAQCICRCDNCSSTRHSWVITAGRIDGGGRKSQEGCSRRLVALNTYAVCRVDAFTGFFVLHATCWGWTCWGAASNSATSRRHH